MGAGASSGFDPDVYASGDNHSPRPRIRFLDLARMSPTYFCHNCQVTFAPGNNSSRATEVDDVADVPSSERGGGQDAQGVEPDVDELPVEAQEVSASETEEAEVTGPPPQTLAVTNAPTNPSEDASNLPEDQPEESSTAGSQDISCPHCGGCFVEQTLMPPPPRGPSGQRSEGEQIHFLLSLLRQSILSQLEQAELNTALRESMDSYKPQCVAASSDAIANLQRRMITSDDELKDLQDPMCVICSEKFAVDNTLLFLPCNHVFHASCCEKWLEIKNSCCVCRLKLPENEDEASDQSLLAEKSSAEEGRNTFVEEAVTT